MKKEEFYYDSRDGKSRLHAVRYSPEHPGNVRMVLQIVHGMAEYVERYREFAEFLTARGILVTGEDHMGHGKSVEEGGKRGYFCEQDPATVLVRDVHRLKKMTQEMYPGVPYVIMGHSMGSFIARNYLMRYGTGISGAIIMGTGMQSPGTLGMAKAVVKLQKLFCGSSHTSKLIDKLAFGGYNKRIPDARTPWDWLGRDDARVKQYMEDAMCGFTFTVNGFDALFELISRLHDSEGLKRIPGSLPVLMLSGADDPVGDYGKGVKRAYDSLAAAGLDNVECKMYQGCRHELLNETNREEIMRDICDWLENRILAQEGWDCKSGGVWGD